MQGCEQATDACDGRAQAMGEQGECGLAERVFAQLEAEALSTAAQTADAAGPESHAYSEDTYVDAHGDAPSSTATAGPLPGYAAALPGFEAGPRLDLGFSHFPSAWGPIVTPAGGAGAARGGQAGGAGVWQTAASAARPIGAAACAAAAGAGRSEADRRNSFGAMPTALAEQARKFCQCLSGFWRVFGTLLVTGHMSGHAFVAWCG